MFLSERPLRKENKIVQLGILTVPFHNKSLSEALDFARSSGFDCVEISCPAHLDPVNFSEDDIAALREALGPLKVSALACYANTTDADPEKRANVVGLLEAAIDLAPKIGTDVVCALAGLPPHGKNKMKTIEEVVPGVFNPLLERAEANNVKIALENWVPTLIGSLVQWEAIFDAVPHPNFGLNFDPSHLVWQDIDPIPAVDRFADRIFHTHAKDTEIRWDQRRWMGNQERGWWRYVIPGRGVVDWGQYFGALRRNGFNGAVSIEHEDSSVGVEEGFLLAKRYLDTVM
jgi:sugar phosphate isomerase/epimerase